MGFFPDAYDLFVLGPLVALFAFYQPFGIPGNLFTFPQGGRTVALTGLGRLSAAAIFGATADPFIFGRLGDLLGRKTIYGIEMLLLVFGALGSALAWSFASLILFRLVLGFGIGGDYPMSATIMSEYSNVKHRGKLVGKVFAMQGFGLLSGVVLGLGPRILFPHNLELVWRALLGAGAIPAAAVYYYRRRLPETPRFTLQVKNDQREAAQVVRQLTGAPVVLAGAGRGTRTGLRQFFARYWPLRLGTSFSWFFFATLVLLWSPSGMIIFLAVIAVAGLVTTLALLKETKQRSLEESSQPSGRGMGYVASSMGGPRVFSK